MLVPLLLSSSKTNKYSFYTHTGHIIKRVYHCSKMCRNCDKYELVIKEIKHVAVWMWDACEVECGICRQSLMSVCLSCVAAGSNSEASSEAGAGECAVQWGECKNVFHGHCIDSWMKKVVAEERERECPVCHEDWVVVRTET